MLSQDENDRLTRVGADTPMGSLLRRYWHPIAAVAELDSDPVRPVRLLGEDLTLFRDDGGAFGLVAARCAHRGISLAYGVPQANGLRCAYHGWTYDAEGQVVDMPFEPTCLPLRVQAYPVQELGGLLFAYLGPRPAPLLPRWDVLVRNDLERNVEITPLPCNWLQCMDNTSDPVHVEHLHVHYNNYVADRLERAAGGQPVRVQRMNPARTLKIDFDFFEYGIYKRRLLEGDPEDASGWTVGHPLIFPNLLAVGANRRASLHYRVPIDDTHTLHFRYQGIVPREDREPRPEVRARRYVIFDEDGKNVGPADDFPDQDMLAWVAQGLIANRTAEHLVSSDRGVMLFHSLLFDNVDRVERGEEPLGVIRDPAKNEPFIPLALDTGSRTFDTVGGEYRPRIYSPEREAFLFENASTR